MEDTLGYAPAHKPAHSWSEISAIQEGLPKMWQKHYKKLVKAASPPKLPRTHHGIYVDLADEEEVVEKVIPIPEPLEKEAKIS